MKYCSECGYRLPSGTEKFCHECGQKLVPKEEGGGTISTDSTSGDVLGAGVSESKNVIGKESAYIREGHAILFKINNPSSQEIVEVKASLEATQQQIKDVLGEVNKIEENTGTVMKEIKVGHLQITKNEGFGRFG